LIFFIEQQHVNCKKKFLLIKTKLKQHICFCELFGGPMATYLEKALRKAGAHIKSEELDEAADIYKQILSKFPQNKKASLGLRKLEAREIAEVLSSSNPQPDQVQKFSSFYNQGQFTKALEQACTFTQQFSGSFIAWNLLGAAHKALDRVDEASKAFEKVTELNPNYPDGFNNFGVTLTEQGKNDEALEAFHQAIKIKPDYAEAYMNMGNALTKKGEVDAAIESFKNAIKIKPDYHQAYSNLGAALIDKDDPDTAIDNCKQAIKIKSDYAEALNNLGNALSKKGDLDDAIENFEKAIEITPSYAEAQYNRGKALSEKGDLDDAMESYKQAIKNKPNYAEAHGNLGIILAGKKDYEAAVVCLKRAIGIKPDYPEAKINLGQISYEKGETETALEIYREVLETNQGHPTATSNLIFGITRLEKSKNENAFNKICSYAQRMEAPFLSEWPIHTNTRDPYRCLQLGFVSGDFRQHAVSNYCLKLFSRLCQYPNITLHAYYNDFREDFATTDTKNYFHHWNSVAHLSDQQLTRVIIKDKIDILIDLSNHTAKNRLCVFARRPAPLQVTAMGLPSTTGLSSMDYFFSRWANTKSTDFSECLAILPQLGSYSPLQKMPPVNALPAVKNGFITFGSFNMVSKVSRQCIALWSRLLREIPNSRFLFAGQVGKNVQEKFKAWFSEEKIECTRIIFHPRVKTLEYYYLHHKVDIHLVAFPLSGFTTIDNALWMGVPSMIFDEYGILTREGNSALSHKGLGIVFCNSENDFVAQAHSLTDDLTELANLRKRLREKVSGSVQLNTDVAAASWEAGLRKIWQRWCSGLDPKPFKLELEDLEYLPSSQPALEFTNE
jgi:protein O-GlcNAc transferase